MKKELYPKQKIALYHLSSFSQVEEVLYGGGAGGGKSYLLQYWQIIRRLKYPNSRGFIGRNDLGDLRKFTIPEMMSTLNEMGLTNGRDFRYNGQDMFIEFYNGSRQYFIDLYAYPSDPDFQRLGSSAYTDGAIEEAAEITKKAKDIVKSRIRHLLTEFCHDCGTGGLSGGLVTSVDGNGKPLQWQCKCGVNSKGLPVKLLMSCNPNPGYLREDFFDPFTRGELPPDRMFVQSLAVDNPSIPQQYIDMLEGLPEADRKRLKDGEWYYDNSNDAMFQYLDLLAAFNERDITGEMYLTGDIARLGKDKTVLGVWHGLTLIRAVVISKSPLTEVQRTIRDLMKEYGISLRNVIVDEDGIGGGIVDNIGCRGFGNNSASSDNKKYANLKHECYFKLADLIEKAQLSFDRGVYQHKSQIIKELQAIRRKAPDGDTKLMINSKDEQKRLIGGASPDFADMIMFRMFFEKTKGYGTYAFGSATFKSQKS